MTNFRMFRLHWRLFFPLVGVVWLIIGITITYFVIHETHLQKRNLENRLLNVNNTVIDAYERGNDLSSTVDFIQLYTDNTTLEPLRITVYNNLGEIVADNPSATISLHDKNGNPIPGLLEIWNSSGNATVQDMAYNNTKSMVSSLTSSDGKIHVYAALPYNEEVLDFLGIDPMIWVVVIALGIVSSVLAFLGVTAVCKTVYSLRDFAHAISSDQLPSDINSMHFSKDELGDVSRNLLTIYRDKIHAEQEKISHERQIGMNVSHELKTPVGIIKGYIDTIVESDDMPATLRQNLLKRAQQTIDRLSALIDDVSMVMNLQENGDVIKGVPVNLYQLVAHLDEDIAQGRIANNMQFEFSIPESCCVIAHESLLTNALLNLVYNAAKHSGGSRMSLRWLRTDNGLHHFTFSDDGTGVAPEHLDRLFDMFYRVDSGRSRKNGGSGLGLPLVRQIITAMGGTISVSNGDAGGLQFDFTLPTA